MIATVRREEFTTGLVVAVPVVKWEEVEMLPPWVLGTVPVRVTSGPGAALTMHHDGHPGGF